MRKGGKRYNETVIIRKCVICGKEFVPENPLSICCSEECSIKNTREHRRINEARRRLNRRKLRGLSINKNCIVCSIEFTPNSNGQLICPKSECYLKRKNLLRRDNKVSRRMGNFGTAKCVICGNLFQRRSYHGKCCNAESCRQQYHDNENKQRVKQNYEKKKIGYCKQCGKYVKLTNKGLCGFACVPNWNGKKKRTKYMETCYACGNITTYKKGYRIVNPGTNLALCKICYNTIIRQIGRNCIRYKGKRIRLSYDPRTHICSQCGRNGPTCLILDAYDENNPVKYARELCKSCHGMLLKTQMPVISKPEKKLGRALNESSMFPKAQFLNGRYPGIADYAFPEERILIECNGTYWHGPKRPKTQKLDKLKFEYCENNGWILIVFTEDELNHIIYRCVDIVDDILFASTTIPIGYTGKRNITIKDQETSLSFCYSCHCQNCLCVKVVPEIRNK